MRGVLESISLFIGTVSKSIRSKKVHELRYQDLLPALVVFQKPYLINLSILAAALPFHPEIWLAKEFENYYVYYRNGNDSALNNASAKALKHLSKKIGQDKIEFVIELLMQDLYSIGLTQGRIAELFEKQTWEVQEKVSANHYPSLKKLSLNDKTLLFEGSSLRSLSQASLLFLLDDLRSEKHVFTKLTQEELIDNSFMTPYSLLGYNILIKNTEHVIESITVPRRLHLVHNYWLNSTIYHDIKSITLTSKEEADSYSIAVSSNHILISDDANLIQLLQSPKKYLSRLQQELGLKLALKKSPDKVSISKSSDVVLHAISKKGFNHYKAAATYNAKNITYDIVSGAMHKLKSSGCPISDKEIKVNSKKIKSL